MRCLNERRLWLAPADRSPRAFAGIRSAVCVFRQECESKPDGPYNTSRCQHPNRSDRSHNKKHTKLPYARKWNLLYPGLYKQRKGGPALIDIPTPTAMPKSMSQWGPSCLLSMPRARNAPIVFLLWAGRGFEERKKTRLHGLKQKLLGVDQKQGNAIQRKMWRMWRVECGENK